MPNFYDTVYWISLGLCSPAWLVYGRWRRKVLGALSARMGHDRIHVDANAGSILIHAVSLGEINATRALVERLRAQLPGVHIVVSTTTDTGFARATELYGGQVDASVIRYPLDFSAAVRRVLDAARPRAVILMELEVWPNFVRECSRRGVPVMVANGRLTARSFGRYRWVSPLVRGTFARLSKVCAQDATYAERFARVGVARDRIQIVGTMKFDTGVIPPSPDAVQKLGEEIGIGADEPAWVAGSTGPGEEAIVLGVYKRLLSKFPRLRLIVVPRKPERFNEVAELIRRSGFRLLRRSEPGAGGAGRQPGDEPAVILGDTMGELRSFYALATVVFVGRTLVDLGLSQHGSDMIEPAALGKPVIVGPFTGNFAGAMSAFREKSALIEAADEKQLEAAATRVLNDPGIASTLGSAAKRVVDDGRGATDRHVAVLIELLNGNARPG